MEKEITVIHKGWKDNIKLDLINNKLYRISCEEEKGTFKKDNNIIYIYWNKWDTEIFISYNNDIYYQCEEVYLNNSEWEDTCYIDYLNNSIIKKSNNLKGIINKINNDIEIIWDKNNIVLQEKNVIKIPNIIHFVYGLKEQKEEFELYRYIAIKSAYDVNKPEKIYFYYYYEPYGYWWEKAKNIITLEKIEPPKEIYGNKLHHYAHQSDLIRLQKLIERGGIYLDIDTICLKSFNDLLDYDFVMGGQTNSDNSKIYGLCNAIILSKKNSEFALKWLDTYKTFRSTGRDDYWDEHSVLKPLELSKIYSKYIKILSCNSFFYPLWYDMKNVLFNEEYNIENYKKIIEHNYCIHLWDTYFHKYLKTLSYNNIFEKNTLYNIFSRKFLKNDISIVFLTYNRDDITKTCLNSYLDCLNKDNIKELIILDNNSNKSLIEYLYEFQKKNSKIKLILSDENLGVCHGRILLFKECKGDIIISIDSDAALISDSFFERITNMLYDEKYGIVGISGAYIKSWNFGYQQDINNNDENEYIVDHIAGCCQAFRRDLFHFGFGLDPFYEKFWVEDTDLSMQSLQLKKINFRICQKKYIHHEWGGSGKNYEDLFLKNWEYFANKWKGRVLKHL